MFKKILISAIMASTFAGVQAASVSGSTNFKVTVPEILVLYHWDEAHLNLSGVANITPANDSDAHEISDSAAKVNSDNVGANSYTIQGAVDTTPYSNNLLKNLKVILQQSWAVRSIAPNDVTLTLSEQNASSYTLKNTADNSKEIIIKNAELKYGTGASALSGPSIQLEPGWNAKIGNIEFTMDLSNVTKAGTYTSNGSASPTAEADDTFLLTLSTTATP